MHELLLLLLFMQKKKQKLAHWGWSPGSSKLNQNGLNLYPHLLGHPKNSNPKRTNFFQSKVHV